MSASPTTVPAVKAKLLTLFKAAVTAETEVWPARTNEDHQIGENVYLGETRGRREWRTIPAGLANSREESYTVTVEVEVYRQGTDIEGTEARMWVLAQALELAVANRPSLEGVPNLQWAISGDFHQLPTAMTDGVLATYVFGVAITARI